MNIRKQPVGEGRTIFASVLRLPARVLAAAYLATGIAAFAPGAQAAKPYDAVIASDFKVFPDYDEAKGTFTYEGVTYKTNVNAFVSFAAAYADTEYMPFTTNVHVFGYQTIGEDTPALKPAGNRWNLDLCSCEQPEGVTNDAVVTVWSSADKGLVTITNELGQITGAGTILLSTMADNIETSFYDDFKAEDAAVATKKVNVEWNDDPEDIHLGIDKNVAADDETGMVLVGGVDSDEKRIQLKIMEEATNDVLVAGNLVTTNDLEIVNVSTNALEIAGGVCGRNVTFEIKRQEGPIFAHKVTASGDVMINNRGHLEADVSAAGKIDIVNGSENTLVGSYKGASISLQGDKTQGALSNVVFVSEDPVELKGVNVLTGPFAIETPTGAVTNKGMLVWNLAGGKQGFLDGYQNIANSGKYATLQLTAEDYATPTNFTIATGDFTDVKGKDTFSMTNVTGEVTATIKIGGIALLNGTWWSLAVEGGDKLVLKTVEAVTLSDVMTGVATNASEAVVSVLGQTIQETAEGSGSYQVPKGYAISVAYTAKDDYMFAAGLKTKTVTVGPLTENYAMTDEDKPTAVLEWADVREIALDTRERIVVSRLAEILPITYATNNWKEGFSLVKVTVTSQRRNPAGPVVTNVSDAVENGMLNWKPAAGDFGAYDFVAHAASDPDVGFDDIYATIVYTTNFNLKVTQPTEGGSVVALTNDVEKTGTIQVLGFENVTIAAKPEDARWVLKEMVALTNDMRIVLKEVETALTNKFEMPCCDTVVTGAFVIAETYRAELMAAVTNNYLATSNNLETLRLHRLTNAETDAALASAYTYFKVFGQSVHNATKPYAADSFTNQLATVLAKVESDAKKLSDSKPADAIIAEDFAQFPDYDAQAGTFKWNGQVWTNGVNAYTSFTACFTNETYGMFATNLHVFGLQTIARAPTMVDPWNLDLVTLAPDGGDLRPAIVSVGKDNADALIDITNMLARIEGWGTIVLGKTEDKVAPTIYDAYIDAGLKRDKIVVVKNVGVETVYDANKQITVTVNDEAKTVTEEGETLVIVPGIENLKGDISVTVFQDATNDVAVDGQLDAPNNAVSIWNNSTNKLTLAGTVHGKDVNLYNVKKTEDAEGVIKAVSIVADDVVYIQNKAHLEANVVAGGKISILNGSADTLVGSYKGKTIEINGVADGAISNVTFEADTPVNMMGENVLTGPFTILAPSVANSGSVTFSVANDNPTTWLSDLNLVNGSGISAEGAVGKFRIKVDADQTTGDVIGRYVIASNAECACDQILGTGAFTLTGDAEVEGKILHVAAEWQEGDIAEKTLYVGAKAYSLYRRSVDADGDDSADYCELVFEVKWGKFAITYDAMGPYFTAGETTVVSDSYVHIGYEWPKDPVRAGYTFLGWYDGVTNGAAEAAYHTPLCYTNEHAVFARWQSDGGVPAGALARAADGTVTPAGNVGHNLVLPDTLDGKPVLSVGKAAFAWAYYKKSTITNFVTGCFVTNILPGAFNQVTTLKTLKISEARDFDDPTSRVAVTIGKRAFAGTRIESLQIPEGTIIGPEAFRGCSYLKEIVFFGNTTNASLTAANVDAFTLCGYANGTAINLYMSEDFLKANTNFVTALKKSYAASNVVIKDIVGYSPPTSVEVSGLDVTQPTEMTLTVSADALIKGTFADVSSIKILYREKLTDAEREYTPQVIRNADGTYTLKFTAPNDGRSGFMRVVIR